MKQIAEAQVKAGETAAAGGGGGCDSASATPSDEAGASCHNLQAGHHLEDWNPNQIVYRKVNSRC